MFGIYFVMQIQIIIYYLNHLMKWPIIVILVTSILQTINSAIHTHSDGIISGCICIALCCCTKDVSLCGQGSLPGSAASGHSTAHCEDLWLRYCGLVVNHKAHEHTQFITSRLSVTEVSRCGRGATWRHVSCFAALRRLWDDFLQ